MTSDQILDKILETAYVKADLLRRIRVIREHLEQKFFAQDKTKKVEISPEDETLAGEFTKDNTYAYLNAINERVKTLPMVNIYVPIDVDAAQSTTVGQWVRANVDREALIEFHVELGAFGGCAFAWNGVYYDYSLKHYMHKKMDAIRKVLDGYTAAIPDQV